MFLCGRAASTKAVAAKLQQKNAKNTWQRQNKDVLWYNSTVFSPASNDHQLPDKSASICVTYAVTRFRSPLFPIGLFMSHVHAQSYYTYVKIWWHVSDWHQLTGMGNLCFSNPHGQSWLPQKKRSAAAEFSYTTQNFDLRSMLSDCLKPHKIQKQTVRTCNKPSRR